VILGNCFPVLGLRHAGQGVSTLIGAWFVIDPWWCAVTLLVAFVITALHRVLRLERFVVLKSVPFAALSTLLPLLVFTLWWRPAWVGLALALGLLVAMLRGALVLFDKST
jgi:glycerol-3-phosphate acyltransferase PlsY